MSEPVLAPILIDLAPLRGAGLSSARVVGNFVLFQIAWFSGVLSAAHDMSWLGMSVIAAVCAWHCAVSLRAKPELFLILFAVLVGVVWESAMVGADLIRYRYGTVVEGLAPPWIVAMWALLAITLNVTLRWLKRRWLLAVVIGGIAGPLSFMGGAKLGAAMLTGGIYSTIALVIGWACLMPLMMWLSDRHDGVVAPVKELAHA